MMNYYTLISFNFLIVSFVAMAQSQEFPPVQPVPAPPAAQIQNLVENPLTATVPPPPPIAVTTISPNEGPTDRMEVTEFVGAGQQMTTMPPAVNNSQANAPAAAIGNVENAFGTANANAGAPEIAIATTAAPFEAAKKAFGATEMPAGEVEMWNFAEGMDNVSTSTTTERPPPPVPASALGLSAYSAILMASIVTVALCPIFFQTF